MATVASNVPEPTVQSPTPKPREESTGEKAARDLYCEGQLSQEELVSILVGEEKFWRETRDQLRDPITLEPLGQQTFSFVDGPLATKCVFTNEASQTIETG